MITEGFSSNIIYSLMQDFGIPVYQGRRDYETCDRVVIHSHKQVRTKCWMENFIEVNVVVLDEGNSAKMALLKEYESKLLSKFYEDIVGEYEGTPYVISFESLGIEEDSQTKSHYVNCKLKFSALR